MHFTVDCPQVSGKNVWASDRQRFVRHVLHGGQARPTWTGANSKTLRIDCTNASDAVLARLAFAN